MNDTSKQTRPLRVLHIGKYFPPHRGGMETYLRDLMSVQKRQGLEVMALVHASNRGFVDSEESVAALDGTAYQVIRSARWFNLGFIPISPGFIWSAFRAIKNFKPDVLHIHHPNSSAAWLLLLPIARRIPWVAHWQSDIETLRSSTLVKFSYQIYRPIEQAILRKTVRIIATSPNYLENSLALKPHAANCTVIPLGLDPMRLPAANDVLEATRTQSPTILFVGRLAPYKGLHNLIKAVAELEDTNCWIAGGGDLRDELQTVIQRHGLSDRVTLLGAVNEEHKWRLYKTCDAVVLPSTEKTEAFGMVLLEAAHFGKPVVVTNVDGSGMTWVAQQLGGRVTAANSSASLAAEIADLLADISKLGYFNAFTYPEALSLPNQSLQLSKHYQYCLSSSQYSETPAP